MRDYWLTQYLLAAVGWTYIIVCLVAIALALWLPKTKRSKALSGAVVLALASILPIQGYQAYRVEKTVADDYKVRLAKAQALFDERCKTAGEKIYKTVEGVEGVSLVNPRPTAIQGKDEADKNWPGAGMPSESTGNQYLLDFLFYDKPSQIQTIRSLYPGGTTGKYGTIAAGVVPEGIKGYQYLETEENGMRIEYSLRELSDYDLGNGALNGYGKRTTATRPKPKYVVTYENIVDPEGRENWVAGARLAVLDSQSGELLAERVQFSFEAALGSKQNGRQPWAFAAQCPNASPSTTTSGTSRFFVAKVLKPIQGK